MNSGAGLMANEREHFRKASSLLDQPSMPLWAVVRRYAAINDTIESNRRQVRSWLCAARYLEGVKKRGGTDAARVARLA